jgi:AcrR family transcriptional regulator
MAHHSAAALVARPVGRPRADPRELSNSVSEEILAVAAGLFETYGYTATSTRDIALEVGLRQASLFHYFARKQDILGELLDRTLRPALELSDRIGLGDYDADTALWLLVEADVSNLCQGPYNLGALQLLPEARDPQFNWFWRRRRQLFKVYEEQIRRGINTGLFPRADVTNTPDLVFGLVESVITARARFRKRSGTATLLADAALRLCGSPEPRLRRAAKALQDLEERL